MKCENCGEREATLKWVGDKDVMAFTHGDAKDWCEVCVLRAQVAFSEGIAANLPLLRQTLQHLLEDEAR